MLHLEDKMHHKPLELSAASNNAWRWRARREPARVVLVTNLPAISILKTLNWFEDVSRVERSI